MPSAEGIPMLTKELIASLLVGVMVTFIVALAWGHQISDLILALAGFALAGVVGSHPSGYPAGLKRAR